MLQSGDLTSGNHLERICPFILFHIFSKYQTHTHIYIYIYIYIYKTKILAHIYCSRNFRYTQTKLYGEEKGKKNDCIKR